MTSLSSASHESFLTTDVSTISNVSINSHPGLSGQKKEILRVGDEEVVIASPLMKKLYRLIDPIAATNLPVLIRGETGSGKKLMAQALNQKGSFSHGLLKTVDCAAIPPYLMESVLFGHELGASIGTNKKTRGAFEQNNGGTVFLDEVGKLSKDAQGALLRVIETKRITRLGSDKEIEVSARVIAATNCDLDSMVIDGKFRKDLFYCLNPITLNIPPLRERPEEIGALASLFIRKARKDRDAKIRSVSSEALDLMRKYSWPGNVRELRNVIEKALLLCTGDRIESFNLPKHICNAATNPHPIDNSMCNVRILPPINSCGLTELVREYERELIIDALRKTSGDLTKAAHHLGISHHSLVKKIRGFWLVDKDF